MIGEQLVRPLHGPFRAGELLVEGGEFLRVALPLLFQLFDRPEPRPQGFAGLPGVADQPEVRGDRLEGDYLRLRGPGVFLRPPDDPPEQVFAVPAGGDADDVRPPGPSGPEGGRVPAPAVIAVRPAVGILAVFDRIINDPQIEPPPADRAVNAGPLVQPAAAVDVEQRGLIAGFPPPPPAGHPDPDPGEDGPVSGAVHQPLHVPDHVLRKIDRVTRPDDLPVRLAAEREAGE